MTYTSTATKKVILGLRSVICRVSRFVSAVHKHEDQGGKHYREERRKHTIVL
jgi:hypothetical protein